MQDYSCDVGTWERGQTFPFKAPNDDEAIRKASAIAKKKGQYLVSVRRSKKHPGPVIWDEFNGRYNRAG